VVAVAAVAVVTAPTLYGNKIAVEFETLRRKLTSPSDKPLAAVKDETVAAVVTGKSGAAEAVAAAVSGAIAIATIDAQGDILRPVEFALVIPSVSAGT
jgi:hypothetical protein